nr:MAG: capsid protein [Cressdnaviricota sp.]
MYTLLYTVMYAKRSPRRKYTSKRKYAGGRHKRSHRPRVSQTLKRYVKKTVRANTPLKKDWNNGAGILQNALGTTISPYQQSILPDVLQGVGEGDRIGDRIKVRSSHIVMNVWARAYNSSTNSLQKEQFVKIWIVKQKQLSQNTTITASDLNKFFQLGSSSTGMSNSLADITRDVNDNLFTVKYQRTYKIGFSALTPSNTVTQSGFIAPNNDFKLHHQFKIPVGKYMKKLLHYDDANTYISNDNLFMIMQTVAYDNTIVTSAPIEYMWEQHTTFQDC